MLGDPVNKLDLRPLEAFVRNEYGIVLSRAKLERVSALVLRRVQNNGLETVSDYIRVLEDKRNAKELDIMVEVVTTNLTKFFREPHHFHTLEQDVVPELVRRAERGDRIRLWSAACSTGEEPFSMAMALKRTWPACARYDMKILGTDVDKKALAVASRGVYPPSARDAVPRQYHDFLTNDEGVTPVPEVASMVTFRALNLVSHWPFSGKFDVIFCRNAAIYFDRASQEKLWLRFQDILKAGGHLFLGHSERIPEGLCKNLRPYATTCYVKTA